jgi:hypothetical protein
MTRGVIGQGHAAQIILDGCGISLRELRHQWELQRQSQLSLRARMSQIFIRQVLA